MENVHLNYQRSLELHRWQHNPTTLHAIFLSRPYPNLFKSAGGQNTDNFSSNASPFLELQYNQFWRRRFLHNNSAQVYNQSQGKRRSPQVAKICIIQNDLIIPSNQVWSKAFLHVSRNSVKTPAELVQVQGSYALQIELVQFMSPDLGDGMKRSVKHLQLLLTATACLQVLQRCTEPGRPS